MSGWHAPPWHSYISSASAHQTVVVDHLIMYDIEDLDFDPLLSSVTIMCNLKHFYFSFLGICGGSASGKTTVAKRIIEALDVQWVSLLSMDSFYKVGIAK